MKNIIAIFCILYTLNIFADFSSALDLYSSGDYENAHKEFLSMAEVGEKRSQYNLGVMYYYGQHVEKNINKAYAWIKLSIQSETSKTKEKSTFQTVASQIEDKTQAEAEFQKLNAMYSTDTLIKELYPILVKPEGEKAFGAIPVSIIEPKWPRKALMRGIQGWVQVQFDLDKSGVPRNLHLLQSFPDKIFSRTALNVVPKWRFKPKQNLSGEAIPSYRLLYTMTFRLEGANKLQVEKSLYKKTDVEAKQGNAVAQYKIGIWAKTLKDSAPDINPNEWFLKAAIQGLPAAQYELGRSLIRGKGCIVDKSKGLEWLIRSATNGEDSAKLLLGSLAAKSSDIESQLRAIKYLDDVKDLSDAARVDYAWMLAISPYKEIANPEKAIELSDSFSDKYFRDDATILEIKAAAQAAMGNFKKAIALQKDALDEAEDMNADLSEIKNRLVSYKNQEKWF